MVYYRESHRLVFEIENLFLAAQQILNEHGILFLLDFVKWMSHFDAHGSFIQHERPLSLAKFVGVCRQHRSLMINGLGLHFVIKNPGIILVSHCAL